MGFEAIERGSVTTPRGFAASGVTAGLKRSGAPDMALIHSPSPAIVAGAFTANVVCAAPVQYDRDILAGSKTVHAVLVNSGNANACTGQTGLEDAATCATAAAKLLNIAPEEVLVSSTGRIGVPLPMDTMLAGIEAAAAALSDDAGLDVADAIMTTDTRPKSIAIAVELGGKTVHIGGTAKGAGMIAPKLRMQPPQATMLAYVTTDVAITKQALDAALGSSLDSSFNRITVDGDTSTNDTLLVLANGAAGNDEIDESRQDFAAFAGALEHVLGWLAKELVLDGEGVTRFVEVHVTGAKSDEDARQCAEAIANSALCKTAWFGADPNWGRILCAAGYSGIDFDPMKINLDYGDVPVMRNGADAGTPEADQVAAIDRREFRVGLDLGSGQGTFTVWTCDLTYEYVKINADYHT
ncbi:MAG: bifunctional glutamate N-acetyltransferase/amino-acid acetyltransferase ArgJ [Lentisphaerae bacterium]|jgi:glutamate N-acetyltransferase / amino-acid N-acetyltransferase|nr:bifunctional glutamate N-acetyltransferase/amino-acid acetyltransferase ArgJ [Lentisphaerota bacterium]MBT4818360.1 bifunctional glutamate N-acetyltransferase/amino-acid acetyltransferase ArgJ [Lentisphaerota bacterium]MBT5607913.1 bifunctional glutamate N-acetyltransferase/amino-acid acetyltransferase ArgJ [Lentisphaerota bacterium]MBT7056567.1 bifunctional glutamate N-acetyltransferase/amino-acid acetyltransferase ArgJ [Lentisphaerota bacterium]MBT7846358.1 bifunctional glutamate N-acetylt